MVFSCENFKPFILGSHVIIHIDHVDIKNPLAKKDSKPRLIRWVLLLVKTKWYIKIYDTMTKRQLPNP